MRPMPHASDDWRPIPGARGLIASAIALAGAALLMGCGDSGVATRNASKAVPAAAHVGAPPVPQPSRHTARARASFRASRATCRGMTPAGVRRAYLKRVRHAEGSSILLKLALHPPKAMRRGPAAAGLAAAIYASSRPSSQRADAFAACNYELQKTETR
jgi:hypothetical protein